MEGTARRSGIKLDRDRLDYELSRRGVTARALAHAAGLPEATLSRARHGQPIREGTLRKLTAALVQTPLMMGADLLLAEPEKRNAAASTTAAFQEVSRASGTTSS